MKVARKNLVLFRTKKGKVIKFNARKKPIKRKNTLSTTQKRNLGFKLDIKSALLRKKFPNDIKRQAFEFSRFFESEEKKLKNKR